MVEPVLKGIRGGRGRARGSGSNSGRGGASRTTVLRGVVGPSVISPSLDRPLGVGRRLPVAGRGGSGMRGGRGMGRGRGRGRGGGGRGLRGRGRAVWTIVDSPRGRGARMHPYSSPGRARGGRGRGRGGERGRGRGGGRGRGRGKPVIREDRLDDDLKAYWEKSGNTEMVAKIDKEKEEQRQKRKEAAQKVLDSSMDEYWKQKGEESKKAEAVQPAANVKAKSAGAKA